MNGTQSPAALEQEIGQTRTELTLTINALEEKLAPRFLVEKGFDMVNDSIGGTDGMNRGLAVLRANPVPFALIALGAAWLIARNTGLADRIGQDERLRAARRRAGEMASDLGTRAGDMAGQIGSRAGGYASDMARRVGLSGDGSDAAGVQGGWMHQATDRTEEAIRSARDSGNAVLDKVNDAIERNPLIVGGLGVVAGAVLAMLLPASRTENEWLRGLRDAFWRQAEQAGQEAASAVRKIAMNAADAAADTAAEVARNAGARPAQG